MRFDGRHAGYPARFSPFCRPQGFPDLMSTHCSSNHRSKLLGVLLGIGYLIFAASALVFLNKPAVGVCAWVSVKARFGRYFDAIIKCFVCRYVFLHSLGKAYHPSGMVILFFDRILWPLESKIHTRARTDSASLTGCPFGT